MRRLALAVLLVAGMAVACQDDGDDVAEAVPTTPSPEVTETPSPSPEPSPEVVTVEVPNVRGKTLANAEKTLQRAGLALRSTDQLSKKKEGTVVGQSLAPGRMVPEGEVVVLTVAEPFPIIPNVVGLKLKQARRNLEREGFDVEVKKEESSQPKETVLSQSPVGGTQARPGRVVTIVVAKPIPPPPEPQPDCTPGYSPCLPIGPSDYDCYGGSGDGPAYTRPGVVYTVTGSDPYGLDSDNDGRGCE